MKKKRIIWTIVAAVIALAFAAIDIAANIYKNSLDTYLNHGSTVIRKKTKLGENDAKFYKQKFKNTSSKNGSVAYGLKVAKKLTDEGEVLLKNDGIFPLVKGTSVTPLGYRFLNPVYGGTGSGNIDASKSYVTSAEKGLAKYYKVNNAAVAAMKKATPYELTKSSLKAVKKEDGKQNQGKGFFGASTSIYEYNPSIYKSLKNDKNSVAVVYLGRVGGEGANLQNSSYYDGTKHELALTKYEKETIRFAKKHFKKVVAIINSSNVMELQELQSGDLSVNGIIWIGGPGATGFDSLADIMVGKVNPSGRTSDIWDADLNDNPVNKNFGNNLKFSNAKNIKIANQVSKGLQYTEYQEGIYYGYRYYETASDLGKLNYQKKVVYPFGYGLSYTSFKQKITGRKVAGNKITYTIKVKNTGKRAGSSAIQLYYEAPYTSLDEKLDIQKSTKNLLAFDKVYVPVGQTVTKKISFNVQDMSSYSYKHKNGDGTTGAYMLEKGDYKIYLGKDSHDSYDMADLRVKQTNWYTNSNPRDIEIAAQKENGGKTVAATNQFQSVSDWMEKNSRILSRSNWDATQPKTETQKALDPKLLKKITNFDLKNDPVLGAKKGSKIYTNKLAKDKQKNGLTLSQLRGKSFNDKRWDKLLDQVDYSSSELTQLLYMAAFTKSQLTSVGKPASQDHDGPQGWGLTGAKGGPDTVGYSSEVVIASTFNPQAAYDFGQSIGQEALTIGFTGWYGPAMNIHRSAFNGRNFEYFSEDPVLTGRMAERTVSGAADQGVISYMKHFVMDDSEQETSSMTVWATEQAIREIYLKAFEIPATESKMTLNYIPDKNGKMKKKRMRSVAAMMTAADYIGTDWCSANYNLLTNIVRKEWGFKGELSTDMFLNTTKNITQKVFRAGNNAKMWYMPTNEALDANNPTDRQVLRNALHYTLYNYVNSNLMQGVAPGNVKEIGMSPWKKWLIAANVIGALLILLIIALVWVKPAVAKRKK